MAAPLSITSSPIMEILKTPIEHQIEKFYSLSTNLSDEEKAVEGKVYGTLNKVLISGFKIKEFSFIRSKDFAHQSWPELQRGKVTICFLGSTLLDYLKEIESFLEFFLDEFDSPFTNISEIEAKTPFVSQSFELSQSSSLMMQVVRVIKPIQGSEPQPKCHSFYSPLDSSSEVASLSPLQGVYFNNASSIKLQATNTSSKITHKLSSKIFDKKKITPKKAEELVDINQKGFERAPAFW